MITPDQTQEALQSELQEAEERIARLETQREAMVREIERLTEAISGYRRVINYRTNRSQSQPSNMLPGFKANQVASPVPGTGRTPGNRALDMPPRTEQFKNTSVEKAFLAIAVASNKAQHADDFVRHVWIIRTQTDLRRAKRTGNSYLAKMAKKGALRKVAPNTYEPAKSELKEMTA